MDAESDDSERWEDFYGSSTELAPALLSIYDALNTSLETNNNKSNDSNESNSKSHKNVFENGITHVEDKSGGATQRQDKGLHSSAKTVRHSQQQSTAVAKSSCRNRQSEATLTTKQRNNIRLLSPNVQRLLAHSDAHVETISVDALQQKQQQQHHHNQNNHNNHKHHQHEAAENDSSNAPSPTVQNFRKKLQSSPSAGHGHHTHKGKVSLLPLSKGAEKLTMAGNELVSTFDSSTEYLDSLLLAQKQSQPQPPPHKPVVASSDDEKTPTNTSKPFTFDLSQSVSEKSDESNALLPGINLLEMEQLAATTQLLSTLTLSPASALASDTPDDGMQENGEVRQKMEAVNMSLVNKSILFNANKSISRSQSLAHPRSLPKNLSTLNTPTSKSVPALEDTENGSTESLDRLTEMKSKFSSREQPLKMSSLLLPEISKLKHRPLSSSSLCSTTSSSSSGSDILNSKLSTSYLASVESLADHSESELTDQHVNMSVLERSCLEIVDSERNYVEDLRQVITGYLCDWKERACLRIDELKVLFSNIEEIYEFSSMLLKELMESSMDPVKIAKCFIELRENFNVYTKYCTSYPEAISLLTKLLQATHTNALLNSTQKMLQHTLPLGSYLLKPVQRILKYHLLLDNLRKHCDVKEVFQAYEIMRQVARNIDQVKRRLEQQSRVKELSGILDGWLGPELTVLGELRLEGLLMDHNKPRMVFLFATMLIITKPKEDSRLQFKSYIHQNNLMLSEHLPGEPTSFYVIPYDEPRNQIKLTAKNRDQKRVWTQHIKEAMLEKFDNIPSRAKELVYKLGDEEERTSGKNTWKWTMNSTSMTPVYLERRNQYRRSELRNRFKLKRKSIADLSFTQSASPKEQLPDDESNKPSKALTRKNSLDDSMVPMLFRLATAVRHKCRADASQETEHLKCSDHVNNVGAEEECAQCMLIDQRSKIRGGTKLKERSKSVPRINIETEYREEEDTTTPAPTPAKPVEIKQYNHKTMPKRVATLKKQRINNKRDTFKFYMDIADFDRADEATVLKITESTENLTTNEQHEAARNELSSEFTENMKSSTGKDDEKAENTDIKSQEKIKGDAQIVFDLLKDNKEFERIYKKPQRKRSSEVNEQQKATMNRSGSLDKPPPLPSSSPPLLEVNETGREKLLEIEAREQEEHIYETLLRNVHVPYKFSPDFKRSKSLQNSTSDEKSPLPPRPESDYVILKYAVDDTLQPIESSVEDVSIDDDNSTNRSSNSIHSAQTTIGVEIKEARKESVTKLSSTNSLNAVKEKETATSADSKPKSIVKRLFVGRNSCRISSLENISHALMSRSSRRKSAENNAAGINRSSRPPERRASDVSEMCRLAMLHRQGSEAVGERMAYLDYADPRTLFNVATPMQQLQRDSFFSLTSSNDSVYGQSNGRVAKNSSTELSTNFEYEDDVEHNLEGDFRDSAIYSDDNEKRTECEHEHQQKVKELHTQMPAVRSNPRHQVPPKLPPKPPRLKLHATASQPAANVCLPNMNQTASSRSWVLQQIENFSK